MTLPRALPAQARIGICAPSGAVPDPAGLDHVRARFEALGHTVVAGEHLAARDGYCAGTPVERLQDFHALVYDDSIDLVMAARGGFGMSHLLPRLDFEACARSGKLFCGFSDFTAFHLALHARTGQISLAGPMALSDFAGDSVSPLHADGFWGLLSRPRLAYSYPAWDSDLTVAEQHLHGPLWGGNLTLLCHLLGTPWFPDIDAGLLFLEDIGEAPYRVERLLMQLELAGVLRRQRAILLGAFTACEPHPGATVLYTIDQVIASLRRRFDGPVITGLPFGHVQEKYTLPFGVDAELWLDGQRCTLSVAPFLRA